MREVSNFLIWLLLISILLVSSSDVAFSANTTTTNSPTSSGTTPNTSTHKIKVVASFYPVYEFVKKVGGDKIDASVLIPIGAEPHDFDPTIQQIQGVKSAAMLVYSGTGMESTWINKVNPKFAIDTSKGIHLLTSNDPQIHAPTDPHIWLDPVLAVQQVENIRDGLSKLDPNNAAYYHQNAQNFIGRLKSLDVSIRGNLTSSNCAKKDQF